MNNISRLARKNRTDEELGILSSGGLFDLFDNEIKLSYRLNDDEFDYLAENMSDEDMGLFTNDNKIYDQKRKVIKLLEKYLEEYYDENRYI
jgi:hypothetical protein